MPDCVTFLLQTLCWVPITMAPVSPLTFISCMTASLYFLISKMGIIIMCPSGVAVMYLLATSPSLFFALSITYNSSNVPGCFMPVCLCAYAFLASNAFPSQLFCLLIPFPMKRTFSVPHVELTTCSGLCILFLSYPQVYLSTRAIIEIDIKDS